MQTKKRYWEGIYWDGFSPEAVGAVPLGTANSTDKSVQSMLTFVREDILRKNVIYVYIYVYIYGNIYMYMYVYVCMYVCTYLHM